IKGRKHPITSTGHADLVELPDRRWYTVFLGTRPYEGDYYNTGRETFLAPVVWENEWPLINPGIEDVQYSYPVPFPSKTRKASGSKYSGNFSYKDDFAGKALSKDWIFLRTLKASWYQLTGKKGLLNIKLRPETAGGKANPSFIARRQQHTNFTASTSLLFSAQTENEKAGLLCFMHEDHFYFLAIAKENGQPVVQLFQSSSNKADSNSMVQLASHKLDRDETFVQLKVAVNADKYAFYFSTDEENWILVKDNVDGKFLSTKKAGGFVGTTVGLYATSLGKPSDNTAYFDWFQYTGKDPVHETSVHK
ncbi:MAG TPA: family 43 glycosylhydrolase, partial [Flavisolibacter sp.]